MENYDLTYHSEKSMHTRRTAKYCVQISLSFADADRVNVSDRHERL